MNNAPTKIAYIKKDQILELHWSDLSRSSLSAEFLRVSSPSAEVRGHGVGQETLQIGKINVAINKIESVGRYAIKIVFSDGHDSGLFDWKYLKHLSDNQESLWQEYLGKLDDAGSSRESSFIDITQL